jgi:hypothetical protein
VAGDKAVVEKQPDISMMGIITVGYHIVQASRGHTQSEIKQEEGGRDAALSEKRDPGNRITAYDAIEYE